MAFKIYGTLKYLKSESFLYLLLKPKNCTSSFKSTHKSTINVIKYLNYKNNVIRVYSINEIATLAKFIISHI